MNALQAIRDSQIELIKVYDMKESNMISASEAKALYVQPPFTQEEVEAQIKQNAATRAWTCFTQSRLTEELREILINQGFAIRTAGSDDFIVSWEQAV